MSSGTVTRSVVQPPVSDISGNPCQKTKTVSLLVMAPFPDATGLDPGRETGPIVIPASIAAANSINARCDMLGDYWVRLLVADSGCDIISKPVSSLLSVLFDPEHHVAGIIGPSCSEATIELGALLAHPAISLLHISPSATSLELLDQAKFPNTFRALGSSRGFVTMYLALIRNLEIKKVAIFFEHVSSVQATAANDFHQRIMDEHVDTDVNVLGISNFLIPLEQIQNQYRLVFVFGGEEIARKLLCLAFHKGMTFPDYQFIFSEIILQDIRRSTNVSVNVNGKVLECTGGAGDMTTASMGIILSLPVLIRRDTNNTLIDNQTTDDFYDTYWNIKTEYEVQTGLHVPVIEINNHQTTYYDSMWAFALALNASIPRFESELGVSLGDYSYGHPNMTNIIRHELLDVEFEGTRGIVDFSNETLDGEDIMLIEVTIVENSPTQFAFVAVFDPIGNSSISFRNREAIIPDSFDQSLIAPPIYVETVVLIIVALTAITLVVFHTVNLKWTGMRSIKVSSPLLNNLIFLGCYLYLLSILFVSFNHVVGDQNQIIFAVKCGGFMWCESIALSLIFGTICIKSWRIRRIFSRSSTLIRMRSRNDTSRKEKCNPFATHSLILYICAIVLLDVTFQVSWNVIDPWFMRTRRVGHNIHLSCDCDYISIWVSLLIGQKAVLTIVVLYLSIATRNVHRKEYNHTKSTNALVYIYIFMNGLLSSMSVLLLNSSNLSFVTFGYLAICLKNILSVIMCTLLVFLPPVLPILKEKWRSTEP